MKLLTFALLFCLTSAFALDLGTVSNEQWMLNLKKLGGKTYELIDFKGQYILLHFWNTWCAPCRNDMLRLDACYEGLSKYMVVLAVSCEKPKPVKQFLEKHAIHMPVFLDADNKIGESFGIRYVPSDRVINPTGKIVVVSTGCLDWVKVLESIRKDGGIREDKTTQ